MTNKLKLLWTYIKKYRRESILAPLFKLLEVVFDLVTPLVVAQMIDVGTARDDHDYLLLCAGILLAMALLGLSCSITAQYFAAKASVGFAADVRQALFDRIQSFSFSELDRLGTDTLITRLNDDVNQVQNGLNLGLRLLLRSPFVVFGAMIMAFTVNVRCALVFAVAIPVLFLVTFAIMRVSIPLFEKVRRGLDRVTGLVRENFTGVRVIRAFCREESSVAEFEESNRSLTRMNTFVGRISALLNPLTYVLINLATVLLIRNAAVQVNLGSMRQGETVALYNYMLQIIVELIKLASLIITLNRSFACANRVADVLAVEPGMQYPRTDAATPKGENPAVRFSHVTFTYQGAGAPSLRDISFCVPQGQTVGIIGGTGSGKSTLVNLISRFYDASDGCVQLNGQDVRNYTKDTLCRKIGVVQQRSLLFQGTVRDNLKWGNEAADAPALWRALEIAQAKDLIERKPGGLDFVLEQNGRNLSGGQKQRLSIARALVKKPEILILDDSASALDLATDAALRRALRCLEKRTTVFLVSQRIAAIRQADQILVLDNGRLVGRGSHAALLKSCEVYREIYESQFPEAREERRQA